LSKKLEPIFFSSEVIQNCRQKRPLAGYVILFFVLV